MKVLVSSLAASGHVAAIKPLVRAALDDGAMVRVVVDAAAAATFAGLGADVAPLPPMDGELAARSDRVWGEAGACGARGDLQGSNHLAIHDGFGAVNASRAVPALRGHLADFGPDLVLADPFEPGAIVAADEEGVPLALATWSISSPLPEWVALLLQGTAEATGADAGSALITASRSTRFSPVPASLDSVPGPWPARHRWHPSPHIPSRNRASATQPFVYATLGTVVGSIPPLANRFLGCLGPATRAVGATCLVTVGTDAVIEDLDIPAGVEVERFVSHAEIMPSADVVVSHGGINTVLDAAACGVPQVVLPMQATDQHHTARRLDQFGAGVHVPPESHEPRALEQALRHVLHTQTPRLRAAELSDEMARLPTAEASWRTARTAPSP